MATNYEPEGPVYGAEVLRLQGRYERAQDEQAHQAEEHVRAQELAAVHGQRQEERHGQGDWVMPFPTAPGMCRKEIPG